MLILKLVWVAIGFAILSSVGLVTYGLVAIQKQSDLQAVGRLVEANKLVSHQLERLLNEVPHAGLARVALIHDSRSTAAGVTQLLIDQVNTMAVPGRVVPAPQINVPLSQWSGELDEFQAGKCVIRRTSELTNSALRERLLPAGLVFYVGCPLIGDSGILYGAVFLVWDDITEVPPSANMDGIIGQVQLSAAIIGDYYHRTR